ncbi:2OG-Fe(II) oxygenase [Roseivirga sp. E12]|uniref:2OG-Fe(II) oxygenase n=1 Tax=Roseivirga sp. E12 TaxID=2819237 RepID=UPI001ABC25F9|nr:2OG-Fe(II) oxygenase [Roseivirga sp. E12]MBO3699547.1 2OG-Fe(II) oxygenase [Roseivirga sp. E12]
MSVVFPFHQPTRPHFAEFVVFDRFFSPQEVDKIRALWNADSEVDATLSGSGAEYNEELRKTKLTFIDDSDENAWIYQKLGQLGINCNNERYGYDLMGFHHRLQLARYGIGDFFDWHLDFGAGEISHRKLSITVQLSDPSEYEGGDLQFKINKNTYDAPRDKGTVVVFPSFIMHRVTPITKGTRHSIVAWLAGPPYR